MNPRVLTLTLCVAAICTPLHAKGWEKWELADAAQAADELGHEAGVAAEEYAACAARGFVPPLQMSAGEAFEQKLGRIAARKNACARVFVPAMRKAWNEATSRVRALGGTYDEAACEAARVSYEEQARKDYSDWCVSPARVFDPKTGKFR
jgi:hypothetical protein